MFTAADVCSDDKDSDTLVSYPVVSSYKRSLEFENFNKNTHKNFVKVGMILLLQAKQKLFLF